MEKSHHGQLGRLIVHVNDLDPDLRERRVQRLAHRLKGVACLNLEKDFRLSLVVEGVLNQSTELTLESVDSN
jgi:hypothetical protein